MARAAMNLMDWFADTGHSRAWLAGQCGVTVACVNHWSTGRRIPTAKHAARIQELTGGNVTPADFDEAKKRFVAQQKTGN